MSPLSRFASPSSMRLRAVSRSERLGSASAGDAAVATRADIAKTQSKRREASMGQKPRSGFPVGAAVGGLGGFGAVAGGVAVRCVVAVGGGGSVVGGANVG